MTEQQQTNEGTEGRSELSGLVMRGCTWHQDGDPDSDTWVTDCGNMFVLNEGSPKENSMSYCCYCGGRLEEEKMTWEELGA